jgi:hypothetical protein
MLINTSHQPTKPLSLGSAPAANLRIRRLRLFNLNCFEQQGEGIYPEPWERCCLHLVQPLFAVQIAISIKTHSTTTSVNVSRRRTASIQNCHCNLYLLFVIFVESRNNESYESVLPTLHNPNA